MSNFKTLFGSFLEWLLFADVFLMPVTFNPFLLHSKRFGDFKLETYVGSPIYNDMMRNKPTEAGKAHNWHWHELFVPETAKPKTDKTQRLVITGVWNRGEASKEKLRVKRIEAMKASFIYCKLQEKSSPEEVYSSESMLKVSPQDSFYVSVKSLPIQRQV